MNGVGKGSKGRLIKLERRKTSGENKGKTDDEKNGSETGKVEE
jgi:hypothetical protein